MNSANSKTIKRLRQALATQHCRLDNIARAQARQRRLRMPVSPHLQRIETEAKERIRQLQDAIIAANPKFGVITALAKPSP